MGTNNGNVTDPCVVPGICVAEMMMVNSDKTAAMVTDKNDVNHPIDVEPMKNDVPPILIFVHHRFGDGSDSLPHVHLLVVLDSGVIAMTNLMIKMSVDPLFVLVTVD